MRRRSSGLSLVVGIDKPSGMTSHDVVNRCRSVFDERRVGHAGTLDPLASGVLIVCVGPASRLSNYLVSDQKTYRFRVEFGTATDTDDAEGQIIRQGSVPDDVADPFFASRFVADLVGEHRQIPPVYSAIKVQGKKSYEAARQGNVIHLEPRDITVFDATLEGIQGMDGSCPLAWDIVCRVSKGTYIRALARDIGHALGCPAHVSSLRRLQSGSVSLEDCVSLDTLESIGTRAALDPIRLLGYRFAYADEQIAQRIASGNPVSVDALTLCDRLSTDARWDYCACTTGVYESSDPPSDEELVSVLVQNRLQALYRYDGHSRRYQAACVFSTGVSRGTEI